VKVRITAEMEYYYFAASDQNSDIPISETPIFLKESNNLVTKLRLYAVVLTFAT